MDKPYILHMLTSASNLSPFDVNMAMDAGWDATIPYTSLTVEDVPALVQDAIFSRSPSGVKRTGIFIGGRDMMLALDMLEQVRNTMVPPFEISAMADPSGAFTTAAGMIAAVGAKLKEVHSCDWEGSHTLVLGGTGPVGMAVAILAAELNSNVTLMSRKQERAEAAVETCRALCSGGVDRLMPAGDDLKAEKLTQSNVVLATAAAGIQMLSAEEVVAATQLKVAADVNAVPPSGIHSLDVMHNGEILEGSLSGAVGVGALAIGNVKYQAQHRLLKQMREADKPIYIHYRQACEVAQTYVAEKSA